MECHNVWSLAATASGVLASEVGWSVLKRPEISYLTKLQIFQATLGPMRAVHREHPADTAVRLSMAETLCTWPQINLHGWMCVNSCCFSSWSKIRNAYNMENGDVHCEL